MLQTDRERPHSGNEQAISTAACPSPSTADCCQGRSCATSVLPRQSSIHSRVLNLPHGPIPSGSFPWYSRSRFFGSFKYSVSFSSAFVLPLLAAGEGEFTPRFMPGKEHGSGMDPISFGGTLAAAMELYEMGVITDADGVPLDFGNAEALTIMAEKTGCFEGLRPGPGPGSEVAGREVRTSGNLHHHQGPGDPRLRRPRPAGDGPRLRHLPAQDSGRGAFAPVR